MMTIEEIQARKECQTFDCKSIQIDPKALAIPIVVWLMRMVACLLLVFLTGHEESKVLMGMKSD